MSRYLGLGQVLLAGICFGFLGIFARFAYQNEISVGTLLTFRFALATIILWTTLLIFQRKLIKIDRKHLLSSLLLGIFGYAIFSTLYFESIKEMSVPLASMILFTFPIFVNLGAYFFLKEKLSRGQVSGLCVGSLGLVLLLWGNISVEKTSAIFYGLGAAISYSIYVLVSGKVQKDVIPISSSLYIITAATVALYIFHQPDLSQISTLQSKQWLIIFGIAIVSTILPMTLFLAGLQKMPSSKASILVMIEPVTAAIAAAFILGESMTSIQTAGALLVLSGVFLDARGK